MLWQTISTNHISFSRQPRFSVTIQQRTRSEPWKWCRNQNDRTNSQFTNIIQGWISIFEFQYVQEYYFIGLGSVELFGYDATGKMLFESTKNIIIKIMFVKFEIITQFMLQWIENPEHNFLESYVKYMSKYPTSNFQILDPSVLWLLWDFIQGHTSIKIKPNPPSSGFLGNILIF